MKPLDRLTDDELLDQLRLAVQALPDAPEALQRTAFDLWPAAPSPLGALAGAASALVRGIAATLSFDSWAAPALAHGMRSAHAPTRHLLFSAEGRDVDLRIAPGSGGYSISGQVLGPDESGTFEVAGRAPGAFAPLTARLDALGEFRLDGVPAGDYTMVLRVGRDEIVLPPVAVGEPMR